MGLRTIDHAAPKIGYIPGPGTYDGRADNVKKKEPSFSMGSGQRPDITG